MEKKNTMLLTVIAVATLLVAVVGATFAYFTASTSGTSVSEVLVTTESNSGATASATPASIYVSSAEMANDNSVIGITYTTTGEDSITGTTATDYSDSDGTVQLELVNGSSENTYTCTYDLVYTGTTYAGEDADITLTLVPDTTTDGTLSSSDNIVIPFADLTDGGNLTESSLTYTVPVSTTATLYYDVILSVTNVNADQTTDLAGKEISGYVTLSEPTCVHNTAG